MFKHPTIIDGCYLVSLDRKKDERGFFQEAFAAKDFFALELPKFWPQDNFSLSKKGVLRGLHYQKVVPAGKLVSCWQGLVYDVCADIRPNSPTFGRHYGHLLHPERAEALYIPPGCAHGFFVVEGPALVHYKLTSEYEPSLDAGIRWDDPTLKIDWMLDGVTPTVSARDAALPTLAQSLKIRG